MGLHMLRAKTIIIQRGREASQTPIGRALFAFFIRADMQLAVMNGNPISLDETWWENDPLYHVSITPDAPILLAADVALTKLSVIIAKLTLLKHSAEARRKKVLTRLRNLEISQRVSNPLYIRIEEKIREQVIQIQYELETWHRILPSWFGPILGDQMSEEDINRYDHPEILSQRYPHFSIGVVFTCAFAINIQLWRISHPEELDSPPFIGAIVHSLFRSFLATPQTSDPMTIPNVWLAALLLRKTCHQTWLENLIGQRIRMTDFFGWKFAYHGIMFEWAKRSGQVEGHFKSIPVGAQEIVPGVSENLWRADGIMNTKLTDLMAEDMDGEKPLYSFQGDAKPFDISDDSDIEKGSNDLFMDIESSTTNY